MIHEMEPDITVARSRAKLLLELSSFFIDAGFRRLHWNVNCFTETTARANKHFESFNKPTGNRSGPSFIRPEVYLHPGRSMSPPVSVNVIASEEKYTIGGFGKYESEGG